MIELLFFLGCFGIVCFFIFDTIKENKKEKARAKEWARKDARFKEELEKIERESNEFGSYSFEMVCYHKGEKGVTYVISGLDFGISLSKGEPAETIKDAIERHLIMTHDRDTQFGYRPFSVNPSYWTIDDTDDTLTTRVDLYLSKLVARDMMREIANRIGHQQ